MHKLDCFSINKKRPLQTKNCIWNTSNTNDLCVFYVVHFTSHLVRITIDNVLKDYSETAWCKKVWRLKPNDRDTKEQIDQYLVYRTTETIIKGWLLCNL